MICRPSTEALKFGRVGVDGLDHQVGHRLAMLRPRTRPSGSAGATCWQNRLATCRPAGASVSSSVEGISISTIGCARPAAGAGVHVGAVHVGQRRRDDDAGGVMIGRALPGRQRKSGQLATARRSCGTCPSRSASASMRSLKSAGSDGRIDQAQVQQLRVEVGDHRARRG